MSKHLTDHQQNINTKKEKKQINPRLITHTARKPKRQNLTKVAIFTPGDQNVNKKRSKRPQGTSFFTYNKFNDGPKV
jgi:hypothetical protein